MIKIFKISFLLLGLISVLVFSQPNIKSKIISKINGEKSFKQHVCDDGFIYINESELSSGALSYIEVNNLNNLKILFCSLNREYLSIQIDGLDVVNPSDISKKLDFQEKNIEISLNPAVNHKLTFIYEYKKETYEESYEFSMILNNPFLENIEDSSVFTLTKMAQNKYPEVWNIVGDKISQELYKGPSGDLASLVFIDRYKNFELKLEVVPKSLKPSLVFYMYNSNLKFVLADPGVPNKNRVKLLKNKKIDEIDIPVYEKDKQVSFKITKRGEVYTLEYSNTPLENVITWQKLIEYKEEDLSLGFEPIGFSAWPGADGGIDITKLNLKNI